MSNQERFDQGMDRILGGIPGQAARPNTRVADSKDIADLPNDILYKPVAWYGYDGKKNVKDTSLAAFLGWIDTGISNIFNAVVGVGTRLDAVATNVQKLVDRPATTPATVTAVVDPEVLKTAVAAAVKEALAAQPAPAPVNLGDVYELKKKA